MKIIGKGIYVDKYKNSKFKINYYLTQQQQCTVDL